MHATHYYIHKNICTSIQTQLEVKIKHNRQHPAAIALTTTDAHRKLQSSEDSCNTYAAMACLQSIGLPAELLVATWKICRHQSQARSAMKCYKCTRCKLTVSISVSCSE